MNSTEAWQLRAEAARLEEQVRDHFPCPECDGEGEHYPGHVWSPCLECYGTGIHIPDEEK